MIKVKPLLFGQHRCHSIYLAFGGDKKKLVDAFTIMDPVDEDIDDDILQF